MKKKGNLFKWIMLVMILAAVAVLVLGFAFGFEANDGKFTDVLLNYAYVALALAVIAWVVIGLIISIKNNPKSIIRLGILLVIIAAVCLVVYFLSPGAPAMNMTKQPEASVLKITDTILNLCYIAGGLAIVSIIVGEIVMAIRGKKA